MEIRKAAGVLECGTPDERQLAEINRHAKSPLRAEEVYVFAVRLCDDRPDRDFERFDKAALTVLAELFVGKTGILDHDWSAENQMGRIFRTQVVEEADCAWLKAWVYMLRSEKTASLIREIEASIKKEVSVGCAVGRTVCSVCGESYGDCTHRKGESYGGELCTAVLCDPVDAYEFSFVAVPAQRSAGVVKGADRDSQRQRQLEKDAADGRRYRRLLRRDVVKEAVLLDLGVEESLLEKMVQNLDTEELDTVLTALSHRTAALFPPRTQLQKPRQNPGKTDSAFLI